MKKYWIIPVMGVLVAASCIIGYKLGSNNATKAETGIAEPATLEENALVPFRTYPTDMLIPLNRMCIPGGDYVSDTSNPEGNYGSGGSPRIAFLFFIEDASESKRHYFLCSGPNGEMLDELKYLGDNIALHGREYGNGWMGVKFSKKGIKGEIISSVLDYGLCGTEPDKNCDSVRTIPLTHEICDTTYAVDQNRDSSWIANMTVKDFFIKLQKAVIDEDKKTVAKMMKLPLGVYLENSGGQKFWTVIRSEQEFIDKYDLIITARLRDNMIRESAENLFVSWRGVMMGEFWMLNAIAPEAPATLIDQIGYFRR